MVADRRSPSGEHLSPDEKVHRTLTYRIVALNLAGELGAASRFNAEPRAAHRTLSGALRRIATDGCVGDRYRIIVIPAGEPWDYDGRIVATVDLRTGQ